MSAKTKLEKLTFSGKENDFVVFQEQFEARMYLLGLRKILLGGVTTPPETPTETAEKKAEREAAEEALEELQYQVWCELIQCLDRKSVMFIRPHKPDGCAAWRALCEQFKSTERPRVQRTMKKLMSHRMEVNETISDYLLRAEELQMDLREVEEAVSDQMYTAIILQGLPSEYDSIVTLLNFGERKTYDTIKHDLINFAANRASAATQKSSALQSGTVKRSSGNCFNCGKPEHRQSECRSSRKNVGNGSSSQDNAKSCFNCGKPGHEAKFCRSPPKRKCEHCGRTNHDSANCWLKFGLPANRENGASKTQHKGNLAERPFADGDSGFSFMALTTREPGEGISMVIDSGCTGYMIKDKKLFENLDEDFKGTVSNANASRSRIEGSGTAVFWAEDSTQRLRRIELKEALYVPEYDHNLVSVKRLNDNDVEVIFGKEPRIWSPRMGQLFHW